MTRLEKKCFLFSVGMHGLLLTILVVSSAFRSEPPAKDIPILTMIPANIVEGDSAGGGSPSPAAAPAPKAAAQPAPRPAPVVTPQPKPTPAPQQEHLAQRLVDAVKHVFTPKHSEPEPEVQPDAGTEPAPKHRKKHEIVPDLTHETTVSRRSKIKPAESASSETSESSQAESRAQARANARRVQQRIAEAFENMATSVKNSGAAGTVIDMPGQGGGEAFAGYETVIYNAYYHAWITPDSVADRLASTGVKIVVARDGTILSAEIVGRSGEAALDRSVERALRAVRQLPPFPPGAHDEQRTFLIRFNLEAKEGSG